MAENSLLLYTAASSRPKPSRFVRLLDDAARRTLDIVAALIGLILLLPLFAWIAWRIKRDTPGPVFYWGLRTGRYGRTFRILKFRTMHEEPESYLGPRVTAANDPRITPFGRWLRESKLNELPQLWNVLIGEMSLVGPRPEDPEISATLLPKAREEILSVRPGITSPASVLYRDEESLLDDGAALNVYLESVMPTKLRLDQLYVRNRSIWLDLDILVLTLAVLVHRRRTASADPNPLSVGDLFSGPFSRFIQRFLTWFNIDLAVTLLAAGISGLVWRLLGPLHVGLGRFIAFALAFSLLFSLINWMLGVNRISWSQAGFSEVFDLFPAAGLAFLLALTFNHLIAGAGLPSLPGGLVFLASSLSLAGYIMVRYRGRLVTTFARRWASLRVPARAAGERVLIVGGGDTGQYAAWLLRGRSGLGLFHVVGFVDDDLQKQGLRINGIKVLGRREDIPRLVSEYDIGILVFAIHSISLAERQKFLEICARTPARVVLMPDLHSALNLAAGLEAENQGRLLFPVWQREGTYLPAQFSVWLDRLAEIAESGDLDGVLDQIDSMRERMSMRVGQDAPSPLRSAVE